MKVLSLLQPWATLAVTGAKTIETRGWTTAYRGRLLIHASKSHSGGIIASAPAITRYIPDFKALPFGAIIGEVVLADIRRCTAAPSPEQTLEEHAFGRYEGKWCWFFQQPIAYETVIPATGRLGLWEI